MDSPCVSVQKEKTTNSTDSKRPKNKYKKIAKHRNNKANRPSDRDRQLIPRKRKLQFMPFGRTPWLSDRISVCLGISSSHPPFRYTDTLRCAWLFVLGPHEPHTFFVAAFGGVSALNRTIWMNLDRLLLLFPVNNKYNNYECVPRLAESCGTCHDQKVALIFWFTVRSFRCPQTRKNKYMW